MNSTGSSKLLQEKVCAEILQNSRWSKDICCVYCLSQKVVKNGVRDDYIQQYVCKSCGKAFNDRTKTIFSNTQMQLNECFYIIQNSDEKSINAIKEELGRSWKTVSDFLRFFNCSVQSLELEEKIESRKRDLGVDYSKFGCG